MTISLPLARLVAAEVLAAFTVLQVLAACGRRFPWPVWAASGVLAVLLVAVLLSRLSTAL